MNGAGAADLVQRIQTAKALAEHLLRLTKQRVGHETVRIGEIRMVEQIENVHSELGYLPFERRSAHLFFSSWRRYERANLLITTNQVVTQCGAVFGDDVVAAAILDRLLHHSHTLMIQGVRLAVQRSTGIGGNMNAYEVRTDDERSVRPLLEVPFRADPVGWIGASDRMVVNTWSTSSSPESAIPHGILILETEGKPTIFHRGDDERTPALSPDGTRIAYVTSLSGEEELLRRSVSHAVGPADPSGAWSGDPSALARRRP